MTENEARSLVVATGRQLLKEGLVVRTWGNVSCRVDEDSFLITPSGLDYMQTTEEDLALFHMSDGNYDGPRKPSSEKGIHASAYELLEDAAFVIHTHQAYATALSVYGFKDMDISDEEKENLGGIGLAQYGLPGTKILKNNVRKVLKTGAHTILLEKHGALIVGSSQEDAYKRAQLLEEVCKRNWLGQKYINQSKENKGGWKNIKNDLNEAIQEDKQRKDHWKKRMIKNLKETYPHADWVETESCLTWSKGGKAIAAQLDDMAQMIGHTLPIVYEKDPCTLEETVFDALEKGNAVLIKNFGAIVNGMDEDDTVALKALVDKACITALHTNAARVKGTLSIADCTLMHTIYQKKYSKLKQD